MIGPPVGNYMATRLIGSLDIQPRKRSVGDEAIGASVVPKMLGTESTNPSSLTEEVVQEEFKPMMDWARPRVARQERLWSWALQIGFSLLQRNLDYWVIRMNSIKNCYNLLAK